MKKVAGTLKIDQAQFRELEAFARFSSDMDPVTALILDKGRKNTKLLIQPQYKPMPVGQQIAILYCGTSGLMRSIPIDQVPEFERLYLEDLLLNHPDVVKALNQGVADEASLKVLEAMAARVSEKMTQKG